VLATSTPIFGKEKASLIAFNISVPPPPKWLLAQVVAISTDLGEMVRTRGEERDWRRKRGEGEREEGRRERREEREERREERERDKYAAVARTEQFRQAKEL